MHFDYQPPVSRLLVLGEPRSWAIESWSVSEFDLTPDHEADLIRMATDPDLNGAASDSREVWAPIHAIRALGLLGAAEAVEPLLSLITRRDAGIERIDDDQIDDWTFDQVPAALIMIGPAALDAAIRLLSDPEMYCWSRIAAGRVVTGIAVCHHEHYASCVGTLATVLERLEGNEPELNASLVGYLADLDAEGTLPLIERAFEAGCVDELLIGLGDVERTFGLREQVRRPPWSDDEESDLKHYSRIAAALLDRGEVELEPPPEPELPEVRMTMPEEIYTAEERRRIAHARRKQRKAQVKTRKKKRNPGRSR